MSTGSSNPLKSLKPEGEGLAKIGGHAATMGTHLLVCTFVIKSTDLQYWRTESSWAEPALQAMYKLLLERMSR